ncbi:hypothetical protein AX15_006643, partial [Amanita polypyramis BW_CC]
QHSPVQPPQIAYFRQPQPQLQPQPQPYPPHPATTVQPLPVVGMSIACTGGDRNVQGLSLDARNRRNWTFSLYGFRGNYLTCMKGCFCPCILYAQLKQHLYYLNTLLDPIQAVVVAVSISTVLCIAIHVQLCGISFSWYV